MIVNGYKIRPGSDLRKAKLQKANLHKTYLSEINLQEADLLGTDFSGANLTKANLQRANLEKVCFWGADLREADLRGANIAEINLQRADVRKARFDFSGFPLWCGSFGLIADDRLVFQLICHITRLDQRYLSNDAKEAIQALDKWKNKFCDYQLVSKL